jgi:hypothetical protein
MHATPRLLKLTVLAFAALLSAALAAQTTVQPRVPKLMPDVNSSAPSANPVVSAPQPKPVAAANTGKLYTFSGRELLAKFTLGGDWIVGDNGMTLASTVTRLVPRGQTAVSYNQRITVQELPTWVNPARLGQEYLKDIMDDCATGTLKPLEKGNVSQFATDILLLECVDTTTQTVKLVYAALVQGSRSHLVFSRLSLLPLRNPNAAAVAQGELLAFKQLLTALFVCTPSAPKLCQ